MAFTPVPQQPKLQKFETIKIAEKGKQVDASTWIDNVNYLVGYNTQAVVTSNFKNYSGSFNPSGETNLNTGFFYLPSWGAEILLCMAQPAQSARGMAPATISLPYSGSSNGQRYMFVNISNGIMETQTYGSIFDQAEAISLPDPSNAFTQQMSQEFRNAGLSRSTPTFIPVAVTNSGSGKEQDDYGKGFWTFTAIEVPRAFVNPISQSGGINSPGVSSYFAQSTIDEGGLDSSDRGMLRLYNEMYNARDGHHKHWQMMTFEQQDFRFSIAPGASGSYASMRLNGGLDEVDGSTVVPRRYWLTGRKLTSAPSGSATLCLRYATNQSVRDSFFDVITEPGGVTGSLTATTSSFTLPATPSVAGYAEQTFTLSIPLWATDSEFSFRLGGRVTNSADIVYVSCVAIIQ